MCTLSFSLFCHASEQPNNQSKSLMNEYNNSFKPQSESGVGESSVDIERRREELSKKIQEEVDAHYKRMEVLARECYKLSNKSRL